MFWDICKTAVSVVTFASALRLSCPLIIGSMGGCFNEKTSTGNLAYECFMLTGCFFGAWGAFVTGSPVLGSLIAILSGLALGSIYGLLVYHLNCNAMIVSVAYNNGAWAMTTLLMVITWGVRGNYTDPRSSAIRRSTSSSSSSSPCWICCSTTPSAWYTLPL